MMATVGALPVTPFPATIAVMPEIIGRSLASVIVPETEKLMVLETPAPVELADWMAARREPAPLSFRFVTVKTAITTPGEATMHYFAFKMQIFGRVSI